MKNVFQLRNVIAVTQKVLERLMKEEKEDKKRSR